MFNDEYAAKKCTVKEALRYVRSGDCVLPAAYGNEPVSFLRELHTIADDVRDVTVWTSLVKEDYPFIMDTSLKGKIDVSSFFYYKQHRSVYGSGHVEYYPTDLRNATKCVLQGDTAPIFVCAVSPMDEDGYFSISFSLYAEWEYLKTAKTIILEVNKRLPRRKGVGKIHISRVSCLYEADNELLTLNTQPADDIDRQIGENVASLINDGDTIQLGFGNVPECVGDALSCRKDLGIHTELLGTSLGKLIESGAVNNSKKNFYHGKSVAGFVLGSQHLYDFMGGYGGLELLPCSYVNDPYIISQNDNMVSVNAALQVDLTGQICSESMGSRQYSGTGGAYDFACGAFQAKGGKGIIALRSTARNDSISKISAQLPIGSAVSISRNIADYVVTEYGIAHLRGASIRQRALALIEISHPSFRKELTKNAHDLLLW